ncbi:flagellar basal body P-ring formation protein FlgA [Marinobacter panjinensis]|uniref:Flagella basal body P-ring formation protein FlgA n=1 Tax=Marinobacter panjinensis TaxID=2576384 RepID=A0A4U6R0K3_9GAMM|nr:flagellar basal body P-ring formation chaperone FlgA [Marinobacter panjinensis]MCR8915624.1 flagellar basal body P-ring formation chaperone FlgA [Marinobacter panjinensis]TKV66869.1 flagellar basal body P-ring formation protein FlgA [Marinobacter panjinensis]
MRITIFVTALLMSANAETVMASNTTAEQIYSAAGQFLEAFAEKQADEGFSVTHDSGKPDARLSLATCDTPLDVSFSGDPWKTTQPSLLVSCEGDRPWRMFLPVSVTITGNALVASRTLGRGERLTESALRTDSVVVNSIRRGAITSEEQLIGMEMRRGVNAGTVFTPDLLLTPAAIERGDHVIISARSGNFSVNSRGKALASGGIGEQVLVENLSSSRTVRARVTAPGRVEIPM